MKRFLEALVGLAAVIALVAWFFAWLGAPNVAKNAAASAFKVEPGESTAVITERLKEEKIIRSKLLFKFALSNSGKATKLQPGVYDLTGAKSMDGLIDLLAAGGVSAEEFVLLVREGDTLTEIKAALTAAGYEGGDLFTVTGLPAVDHRTLSSDRAPKPKDFSAEFDFLKDKPDYVSLEGFLFPDTYRFFRDAAPEDIVRKMLQNFDRKLTPDLRTKIRSQGKTVYDVVTMASIVEREVHQDAERPKIADLFWRRLEINMALQADSTVNYVTGKGHAAVSLEDTKNVSQYNTYKYPGLPLGPISNPGMSALEAAISPERNDAWYFLTDEEGNVHYAVTFEQHVANKQRYLR